jgi:hypothetical protein
MQQGFSDRLLNVCFKFAKVISVLLAVLLVLAFLGGIGWSIKQSLGGGGDESGEVRFDSEMNRMKSSMSGAQDQEVVSSGAGIELSNRMRSKYGDSLGKAMTNAQCSTEQYENAMRHVTGIAADDDTEPYVDDLVDGAIKWFNDAAAYQKSVGGADSDWYCSEYYWASQTERLQAKVAQHQLRMLEILKGLGFSFIALLAAFALMVIPAIYRIEESVRNRPLP